MINIFKALVEKMDKIHQQLEKDRNYKTQSMEMPQRKKGREMFKWAHK